ncbi:MAG TPA: hypothetical protein VNC22_22890 [Sporichthya sp.]|jgi:NTP pyrophosphatase (non-canonical NTP hydrolase)|nr:hypothetical protein [Sporichthya sp.]
MSDRWADFETEATAFQRKLWPDCTFTDVIAKAQEELGEVAKAHFGERGMLRPGKEGGDVPEEVADVLIALVAGVCRFYGVDVLEEARAKLVRLG